jgi:hypothetical protein
MSNKISLAENMIRFGVKNLSYLDKAILAEQGDIEIGSKKGTINIGKQQASGGVDTEADSSKYDIPFPDKDGAWWVQQLANSSSIPYKGSAGTVNIVPSIPLMEKLMDSVSLQNWQKLKKDPKHVKQGVAAIVYFTKTNAQMKWTNIFVGNEEFVERMKAEGGNVDWQQDIVVPLSFPQNPTAQFFEDNTAVITDAFKAEVEGFIQSIKQAAVNAKIQNPEYFVLQMSISTSSSRFRNSEQAANLTWAQLSEQRARAAQDYMTQAFEAAGIKLGTSPNGKQQTKYVINAKGENGDGSSGPNPPGDPALGPVYAFNTDGRGTWDCVNTKNQQVCTYKDRNKFGQPHKTKAEYDVHKYLICTVDLVLKNTFPSTTPPTETPPTQQEIKGNVYDIEFYRQQKGVKIPYWYPTIRISFNLPNLNLDNAWNKFVNRITPGAQSGKRTTDCFFKD